MVAGTLYTYPDNFRAAKALIAAQYSKADVKVATNFVFGETNKTKEFQQKFPRGKVPAFEGKNGELLQDSNGIAYYVANEQLTGKTDYDRAQILQWIGFAEGDVLPAGCAWVFPILGIIKNNPSTQEAFQRAKNDMKAALTTLNDHLLTKTYLVGERITLADIVVACNLLNPYKYVLDPDYRKPFVNVNRWFLTLINQPEFKAVLGDVVLCDKPAQAGGAPSGDGKNKKKEEKKQQQQQEKKEKPKKETPKKEPEEEMDAAEAALAAEPKSKDPFDSMPKGTFNMDDFKRVYSNEDESKSIPYFWEKFDPENYSIWYGEYKYPEELTKVFMSCNLITGMFQRLDKMRKQAFASVCLFGEDNNSTISGVWVWRGKDLVFPLSPDWQVDYEVYDWKKLDPNSEETKKLVQNYFSWTGEDKDGRKFNQGKIFK
ncbi:elongation factor 1-gamma isoform X2 [Anthonomus grandis grandis]|uniref:elongation factor 1-gamma isoform X2 n=1 Tax=Anthonomus grandis grandis TaxID=2921223 RepID=UPI0021667824|nr:elongation factor 1-gamma isoform X2 [Anthonomus grandis grandis]